MRRLSQVCLLFTLFFITIELFAFQQDRLDSLEKVYRDEGISDSLRLKALQEMSFSLIFSDPKKAKVLIQKGLVFAKETLGSTLPYYELYQNLGIYYDVQQQTDSSFVIFSEILEESKRRNWAGLEQRSNNNLGMNSLNTSKYRQAIEYFSEALALSRKDPKAKEGNWVNYLSNLGLANQELELYNQAIQYHLEALEIRERLNDPSGIAISSANLGICYNLMGKPKEAEEFFQKAIQNAKLSNNLTLFHRAHDNLGSLYNDSERFFEALGSLDVALDTTDGYSLDPKLKLSIMENMAAAWVGLEQPDRALRYTALAEQILESNPQLYNYTPTLLKTLAKIYFQKGDFQLANRYFEDYEKVNRDIFNEGNATLLRDLHVKYDLEAKENQIALQNAELQEKNAVLQRNYLVFAVLGLLLALLGATFIDFQNRNKRKQELLVKDREIKVREAYIQASLESQEQERRRMAQDLHDGFGQYISALRLYVSQLKSDQAREEFKSELVARTDSVLDEMSKEISNVVYDLMPATLFRFGLKSALEDLAQRINVGQNVQVQLEFSGLEVRLDELVEINLFRICQEWINNVLKYSGAKTIRVSVQKSLERLRLSILDDGQGFDASVFIHSKRNGWKNINTRVGLLNAQLQLFTEAGIQGTELLVSFTYLHRIN